MTDQLSKDLASLKIDRGAKPPGKGLGRLLTIVLIGGAAGVGYLVVYPKLKSALTTNLVATGEIQMISPAQAQVQLTATGYVVAQVSAKVAAKVPGRIAEIFVEEGALIAKGAKVARLEDVDHKTAIATARARTASARARVQIAKSNVAELRVAIDRDKPLAERGVIPKAPVDDMEARIGSLHAAVKAAEAEVAAAEAETKSLEVQLGSYIIVSPISGTVVDKLVEVGEGVSPGFGTPGVVEVVDMSSLVVEVDVPEARLDQVGEGRPTEIVLDAYPSRRFAGTVKEIGRRVNRSKATVPVKIRFDELGTPDAMPPAPASLAATVTGSGAGSAAGSGAGSGSAAAEPEKLPVILPEMAARVSFLAQQVDAAARKEPPKLVVPSAAVVQRSGANVVFIHDEERVRMTVVELGGEFGGGRELKTQLPVGTKVVINPAADLKDGAKVKEKK